MIYVVPSLKAKEKLQCEGKAWAESQGFAYVPRGKRTIQDLMDEYGEDFLVYSSRGPQIDRPEGSHFFSLNMAELRIQNLRKGQRDHLLEALMGVKEYDLRPAAAQPPISVLDCTCGFGADAAVASFGLPAGSRVDALEVSPLLEAVTAWGWLAPASMPWKYRLCWKPLRPGAFPTLSIRKTTSRRRCAGFPCAVATIAIISYPMTGLCTTSSISTPCSSGLSRRAASSSPSGPSWNTAV